MAHGLGSAAPGRRFPPESRPAQVPGTRTYALIEVEVQNETHQTQVRLKVVAVPRIGEGIRLQEPDGGWASYDVLDLWYQKAEFGDVWVPFIHVRMTPPPQELGEVLRPDFSKNRFDATAG